MSTITSDVATIQDFASSSTLDIVVDLLTIVFMVGLMFWLDWDFTLIAVAFTPVLLVFVFHFKKAVKEATRAVRVRQSEVLSIVQRGLGSIRVTKAFGRQDLELAHLEAASHATVARRAARTEGQVADVARGQHRGGDLHRDRALEGNVADRRGNDDRRRADRLPRLSQAVLQTGEGSRQHDQHRSRRRRSRWSGSRRSFRPTTSSRSAPTRSIPAGSRGAIAFDRVSFGYDKDDPVLHEVSFTIEPGQVVGIVGPTGSGKSTVLSLLPRFYDPRLGRVS